MRNVTRYFVMHETGQFSIFIKIYITNKTFRVKRIIKLYVQNLLNYSAPINYKVLIRSEIQSN